jgi:hypothetical protein
MGGWFDGIGAAVIGGGLSWLGSRENSQNALQAAQTQANALNLNADRAFEAAHPWDVGGLGGTYTTNKDNQSALMGMSPELSDIYQGGLTRSGLWGEQAAQYGADPFAAADVFYQQQQPYFQEQEDQLRTDAETRLLAQGRLGGTGGQKQLQGIEDSIAASQNQRRTNSMSQAQSMIANLLGRETGDIGQSVGLLNVPLQYANVGNKLGGSLGSAAQAGLASRGDAAKTLANSYTAAGTGFGNLAQVAGGLFTNNFKSPAEIAAASKA